MKSSFGVKRERPPSDEALGNLCQLPILLLLPGHPVRKNSACLGDIFFQGPMSWHNSIFSGSNWRLLLRERMGSFLRGSVSLLMLN